MIINQRIFKIFLKILLVIKIMLKNIRGRKKKINLKFFFSHNIFWPENFRKMN